MTTLVGLQDCDGFLVATPEGGVGRVEETWHDEAGEPAAFVVRTGAGRRSLLLAQAVVDVDRDVRELLVGGEAGLKELDPSRALSLEPAEEAAEGGGRRPVWRMAAMLVSLLALLVSFEIALAFLAAYLVTGHWT